MSIMLAWVVNPQGAGCSLATMTRCWEDLGGVWFDLRISHFVKKKGGGGMNKKNATESDNMGLRKTHYLLGSVHRQSRISTVSLRTYDVAIISSN